MMNGLNNIINSHMKFSMKTYEIDDEIYSDEDVLRFINESKSRKEQTEIRLQELENENHELKRQLKCFDGMTDPKIRERNEQFFKDLFEDK